MNKVMKEGNTKTNKKFGPQKESLLTPPPPPPPPPPLDAYVPICWYTAVGFCAVRKFGFFLVVSQAVLPNSRAYLGRPLF